MFCWKKISPRKGIFDSRGIESFGRVSIWSGVVGTPNSTRWKKAQMPTARMFSAVPVTTCCWRRVTVTKA